jgi:tetratricopeptide (TPR) repeat protein
MDIREMQEAPKGPWTAMEEIIKGLKNQYEAGTTKEESYHSQLALLHSIMKQPEECRLHAGQVSESADLTDILNMYISLARIYVYEKNLKEAISYYEKCLLADPDHEMALDEIAWCCYHEKRYEEAEKWFRKGLALEEEAISYTLWEGMGLSLSELKKYKEAIPYFEKALSLDTNKVNVHYFEYLIGLCYAHENDFYRALAHYIKSLDADPRFAPTLNNIGALYYEQEADIKTAIEYFKKAEKIAEDEKDTQTLQLVYINLSRLYNLLSDYDLKDLYNNRLLNLLGLGEFGGDNENDEDDDWNNVG